MHRYKRTERVSHLLHREISAIIDQKLRDNRISMVTVTGIDLSNDLKNARVYVSIFGNDTEIKTTISTLNGASNFVRAQLGERVILKYLPKIVFYYDYSTVEGMHIDKLLDELKK